MNVKRKINFFFNEVHITDFWDNVKCTNIHIKRFPKTYLIAQETLLNIYNNLNGK